jgi:hypothetical protein
MLQMRAPVMVALGLVTNLAGVVGADARIHELHAAAFSPPESVLKAPPVLRI